MDTPPSFSSCPSASSSAPSSVREPVPRKTMGFWGCLSVFGILFFLMIALVLVLCFAGMKSCASEIAAAARGDESSVREEFLQGNPDSPDTIAVIDIRGVILSSDAPFGETADSSRICEIIREAASDNSVRALIVRLDTPGGEVTASDEIYHALKTCGKPVVARMESMAASGGYYIASAANKIVANPHTMTGSIGVIIEALNYSKLMRFLGLETEIYASGKMKAMLSGSKPTEAEEKEVVNNLVAGAYSGFVHVVSEGRNIPENTIRTTEIGDGRIFSGEQALALGLVDELGYFDDAVRAAEKLANLAPDSASVSLFSPETTFRDLLLSLSASLRKPSARISLSGESNASSFRPRAGVAYYLPGGR